MPPRLRVGVLCRGTTFRAWEAAALRALFAVEGVQPAVLVVDGTRRRPRARRDCLVWRAFRAGWITRRSRALEPVELSSDFAGVPARRCVVEHDGPREHFSEVDVGVLRELDLDVVVQFAFGPLRGGVLDVARYGIWSYQHGDERRYRDRACYGEAADSRPTVEATLQRLTDRLDTEIVLHRGTFKATAHSYVTTYDVALLGSAPWLARTARAALSGDLDPTPPLVEVASADAPTRGDPGNGQVLAFLARQAGRQVAHTARALTRHQMWEVGQLGAPPQRLLTGQTPPVRWIRPLLARSAYLADPFPHEGGALVEKYDYRDGIGRIQRLVHRAGDGWRLEPDLVVNGHASYPSPVIDGQAVYMTPQLSDHRGVRLYRHGRGGWDDLGAVIEGVAACDPTLVSWREGWYMFFTDAQQGANSHLHCWVATSPMGPWTPHALNPVKTDVSSARPAGTPFVHEGALYRPAQDCSISYGAKLVLNRVEVLDPVRFAETPVRRVGPLDALHPDGVHTLSSDGSTTWVDGCHERFVGSAFRRELFARVRRLRR